MTKREMIEELAQQYPQFPQRRVEALVNEVFAGIAAALAQGERVELRRLGTFRVKDRPARTHYNPRTRAPVAIAAQRVPVFRASKVLLWLSVCWPSSACQSGLWSTASFPMTAQRARAMGFAVESGGWGRGKSWGGARDHAEKSRPGSLGNRRRPFSLEPSPPRKPPE